MNMNLKEHHNIVESRLLHRFKNPFATKFEGMVIQDGICGVGKTTAAIEHIKTLLTSNLSNSVIYVGIYLDELHRVAGTTRAMNHKDGRAIMKNGKIIYHKSDLACFKFQHPYNIRKKSKLTHLKELIELNKNIVITHKLFLGFDKEIIELLKVKNYHLIIDEEPSVIESVEERYTVEYSDSLGESHEVEGYTLGQEHIRELEKIGSLNINKTNQIVWYGPELLRYRDVINDIKNNHLDFFVKEKENHYIWRYNPEVFTCFKTIHLLTYLFRGSVFNAYLDINKIPYIIQDLTDESIFQYRKKANGTIEEIIKPIHNLVKLYLPNTEYLTILTAPSGGDHLHYSSGYFDTFLSDKKLCKSSPIKNALGNFFKTKHPVTKKSPTKDQKMWTTIKKAKEALEDDGYKNSFVSFNKKATNEYKEAVFLAFVYNPYMMPDILHYIKNNRGSVSNDSYANSILIQWVFRSALREGSQIKLFIASPRMQSLFNQWLMNFRNSYEDRIEIRDTPEALITQDLVPVQNITLYEFLKIQPGLRHIKGIQSLINNL